MSFQAGRPCCKPKKLYRVTAVVGENHEKVHDRSRWADIVEAFFRSVWRCGDTKLKPILNDWFAEHNGQGIHTDRGEAVDAVRPLCHGAVLDCMGCCASSLKLLAEASLAFLANVLSSFSRVHRYWESFTLSGKASAKTRGAVATSKIRTILPGPSFLATIDATLAKRVNVLAGRLSNELGFGSLEAAKRHRQVLDIAFPAAIALERGLDSRSEMCVAQANVEKYDDNLSVLRIARWCENTLNCSEVVSTLVAVHSLPSIRLNVGGEYASFSGRTIGIITGSRSAAAAGRLQFLDVAARRLGHWKTLGLDVGGFQLGLATYVGNLVAIARTPESATRVLDDCAERLSRRWQLRIGVDPKEYLTCRAYPAPVVVNSSWQRRYTSKTLGHRLDDGRGVRSCTGYVFAVMIKAFFGNTTRGLLKSSHAAKLRFLRTAICAIARFRWTRWPYTLSLAIRIDALQRRFLYRLFPVRRRPREDTSSSS